MGETYKELTSLVGVVEARVPKDGPDEDSVLVKDAEDSNIIVNPLFRRCWSLVKVRSWTILLFVTFASKIVYVCVNPKGVPFGNGYLCLCRTIGVPLGMVIISLGLLLYVCVECFWEWLCV